MALQTVVNGVLWNLDVLSNITSHQTLLVQGDKLDFDNRYLQIIRRPLTQDSRSSILQAIQRTFQICEEVTQSYVYVLNSDSNRLRNEKTEAFTSSEAQSIWLQNQEFDTAISIFDNLKKIIERETNVVSGLQALSNFERYAEDKAFKIEMKSFIEKMRRIARRCQNILVSMRTIYNSSLLESGLVTARADIEEEPKPV